MHLQARCYWGFCWASWRDRRELASPRDGPGDMKLHNGDLRLSASDVSNYLACRHLTSLDQLAALGRLKPDRQFDVGFEKLVERGEAHEARVLARFRADGLHVVEIPESKAEAVAATLVALREGAAVIYQGVL